MTTAPDDALLLSNKEDTVIASSMSLDGDIDLDLDFVFKPLPPDWDTIGGIPAFKKEELSVYPPPMNLFVFLSWLITKSENIIWVNIGYLIYLTTVATIILSYFIF